MSDERFGIGGVVDDGVWTATPIYLDSLVDTAVDSPTDGFVLTYEASSGKWKPTAAGAGADTKTEVYEAGVQVGTVARAINFDGDDFNVTEEAGPGYFTITFAGTGMAAHDMTGAYHTEDATGGAGNVIRATGATAFAWAQLAWGDLDFTTSSLANLTTRTHANLSDAPTDAHHNEAHVLAVTGPHTGTLPLTDLAVGSLGSLIRRGATDWEELILGTNTYVLKAGATQFDWGQVDYSELTGTQPDPVAHVLSGALHTASGLSVGDAIMADSATTFSWQTPSYYSSFSTDFAAESLANLTTRAHSDLSDAPTDAHHTEGHVLAVTGPHTGTLPWADMDVGTQGSVIRRGAADWEEYVLGTLNYALVCTATDAVWAQYDYSWLANIPSTFAPSSHGSSAHTGAIFAGANDSFGAFYLDMDDIGVPADPAVGQRRIFVNTADGKLSVRTNASTTISLEEQGGTDADAIHDNVAQEIQPITGKGSPVGADVIIIEDSADSWNKKSVTITNLPGGADPDAIHDNVDNEIQPITPKGAPVGADVVLIEDSAASWAKKSVLISNLPAGSPSFGLPVSIDIGDAQAEGSSGDSSRADHQHQFAAPSAGYPLDVANTEDDGTASTPARSDHVHAHGTITSASAHRWSDIAAMPDTTTTTIGKATPTAVVLGVGHNGTSAYVNTFYIADHAHTTTAGSGNQVDYTDLANIPSDFTPASHVLATSGPHSGTLPLADLAVGSQGSVIRRGAADWEELSLSTLNYALVCTATDAVWAQYDYSWLANIPSTFAPTSHGSSDHTGAIFAGANDSFGAFYLDMDDIGVPADPAVGVRRIFVNTADGKLSVRTNASTTVSLEEQGGGVTWGIPTGDIDIGDAAVEGTSGNATRADHQHAFSAPSASYPVQIDIGDSLIDGTATTPARSDHGHAFPAPSAGYPLDIAAAEDDGTSTTPARADHVHAHPSGLGVDLHHSETHALATSGPHTDTLPLTDLAVGTQGGLIRRGAADWEEYALGTQYQYLRAGASDVEWQARTFTVSATLKAPATGYTTVWRAPFGCTCTKLEGRQKGGTSTIINARYNGTTDVATGDLTLTAADTWYSTTGINQTAWSATDWLEIEVQTLGSATEITFVLTFTEP